MEKPCDSAGRWEQMMAAAKAPAALMLALVSQPRGYENASAFNSSIRTEQALEYVAQSILFHREKLGTGLGIQQEEIQTSTAMGSLRKL